LEENKERKLYIFMYIEAARREKIVGKKCRGCSLTENWSSFPEKFSTEI